MAIRAALGCSILMLAASCSGPPEPSDLREESAAGSAAGPDIAPTAAPGVAFSYDYRFRLPGNRIAAVQEEHAQACEKIGVARCRITGLRYRVLGEDRIEAELAFKLAPEIARAFGKGGIAAVEKAEGMVVETEIGGTDVSTTISTAKRNADEAAQEIARIEAELKRGDLKSEARAELLSRLSALRERREQNVQVREDREQALANTPMTFTYASGSLVPGFDARSPIREAFQTAGDGLIGMVAFLIVAIGFLFPLALAAAVIAFLAPRAKRAWARLSPKDPTES